jgi:hypothetical protein
MSDLVFEGIATLEESDDETQDIDIYTTILISRLGHLVSWHGTFSLLTPLTEMSKPEGMYDMELSDGRRCQVEVRMDEKGQYTFRGLGLPPGYMNPGGEIAELKGPTPNRGNRLLSNAMFGASAGFMTASFWIAGHGLELAGTSAMAFIVAVAASPKR